MQGFGHVAAQVPLQHSMPSAVQSDDVVQVLGHGSYWTLRHRPAVLRLGSTEPTEVQQISPLVVLQSLLWVQALGHWLAAVQNACL